MYREVTIPIPHKFEKFREKSFISMWVVGAGLSRGLVPVADELIEKNKEQAENTLGIEPIEGLPIDGTALYVWSEAALDKLDDSEGIPKKLKLAKALEILKDDQWYRSIDFRTASKKHRIIARFMMEGAIEEIWSLNWDCHIENAMEAIGFKNGDIRQGISWGAGYHTILTDEDFDTKLGDMAFRKVLKPHGCVRSLMDAERFASNGDFNRAKAISDRFMITNHELMDERNDPLDIKFNGEIETKIRRGPLVAIGWKILEENWQSILSSGLVVRVVEPELESLSIIDPTYNEEGHAKIAALYGLTKDQVHIDVRNQSGNFCADTFFLWLQSLYVLDQLLLKGSNIIKPRLTELIDGLYLEYRNQFIYDFTDEFIPAWLRMCWRSGVMVDAIDYSPQDLQMPDDHIILRTPNSPRPDLKASASILVALLNSETEWDLVSFSGALYDEENLRIVIPIPMWNDRFEALSSIKPLIDRFESMSMIRSFDLLPMMNNSIGLSVEQIQEMKSQVAQANSYFQIESIGIATDLLELIEVDDE